MCSVVIEDSRSLHCCIPITNQSLSSLVKRHSPRLFCQVITAFFYTLLTFVIYSMADPRQNAGRPDAAIDPEWARGLTTQFESLLQNKRLNGALNVQRLHQQSPSLPYNTASSVPSIPQVSTSRPVSSASSSLHHHDPSRRHKTISSSRSHESIQDSAKRFRSLLVTLSETPIKYENPGLLDEALMTLPLDRIYDEAEEESQVFAAVAESNGGRRPEWGYQDCVIRALLRYVIHHSEPQYRSNLFRIGGSSAPSSAGLTIHHVLYVTLPPCLGNTLNLPRRKESVEP